MIYFVLVFQQFLASTTHIIAQDAAQSLDPGIILLFRCSIATVVLALWLITHRRSHRLFDGIERADLWRLAVLGFFNVPVNQLLFLRGLKYTTPANSALLYAMTPALVFLLTLFMHRERSSWTKIGGIVLAFVGVALIIFEHGASLHSDYTLGNLLIFCAVIAWAMYTLLGKPLVEKYGALRVTGLNMLFGTLMYIPIGLLTSDLSVIPQMSGVTWLEVLHLAIVASVINYFLWFYALGKMQTSKVAIFQNLQPVMTTVMAIMLGKAILTGQFLGGGLLALIGVILVQFG